MREQCEQHVRSFRDEQRNWLVGTQLKIKKRTQFEFKIDKKRNHQFN